MVGIGRKTNNNKMEKGYIEIDTSNLSSWRKEELIKFLEKHKYTYE